MQPVKSKVLIVDDSEFNRSLLADILSDEYDVLEASNGMQALTQIDLHPSEISLVLLDIVMPVMDGFEVLSVMNRNSTIEEIPVIMISSETSPTYIDHAYDLGAAEYISRPFDMKTVLRRVKNTIMLYAKQKTLKGLLTEQMLEKEKSNMVMVEILGHIVEFRNGESGLHVMHIRVITEALLYRLARMTDRYYNLSPQMIALITNASALHDIGKISISEAILNKPGKLTREEYEIMKTHSAIGAQMLSNIKYYKTEKLVQVAHDICRWHHERYDGHGYPDGLVGDEIPISAQVVALADVYDALTSKRVYKPALSSSKAMEMILGGECGAFNPLLLECLKSEEPLLESRLHMQSNEEITREGLDDMARMLIKGGVSDRTLAQLEQERTKYQFMLSTCKDFVFEYTYHSDVLTLSSTAAATLGLPQSIAHPGSNALTKELFDGEDFKLLVQLLKRARPDEPIISGIYTFDTVYGEQRYQVVARPMFIMGANTELTGFVGRCFEVGESNQSIDDLREISKCDALTRLFNRAYAAKASTDTIEQGLNMGKRYALLLIDIDYFYQANQERGYLFGDKLLEEVARRLQASIRVGDIAARTGGDEFMLLMEYKNDVSSMVSRVFSSACGCYQGFDIALSMGVSFAPQNGQDFSALYRCAERALYFAKESGRHKFCLYDDISEEKM